MIYINLFVYYFGYLIFPLTIYLIWQYNNINKFLFSIGIIFCLGFIYSRFIETKILLKKYYQLNFGLNKKIRIAVFADLHFGTMNRDGILKKIVKKINESRVDIVFAPGDFAHNISKKQINTYFEDLKNIKAPIYAVFGNHDYGMTGNDVSKELTEKFKELNVKLITNKVEEIKIKNKSISIVGLDDYDKKEAAYDLITGIKKKDLYIVLAHNPDAVYEFPDSRPDLLISGHTHGGQIRLPILYKKAIPSNHGFNKGFYDINNVKVFITSGVGNCTVPFRFLVPPELNIIDIN